MFSRLSKSVLLVVIFGLFSGSCSLTPHQKMVRILQDLFERSKHVDNFFYPQASVDYYDSLATAEQDAGRKVYDRYMKAYFLIQTGEPEQAISIYENLLAEGWTEEKAAALVHQYLGVAYQRVTEQVGCRQNKTSESCIFPFEGGGIFQQPDLMHKAIANFLETLKTEPDNLECRWLLNLAYMSIAEYPGKVPPQHLIPNLDSSSAPLIKPFHEMAEELGITAIDMSGGAIMEDFTGDGYLDIATSSWGLDESMHFWVNNGDGTFRDQSKESNLSTLTGGLNMMQGDYNNDGFPDIFVTRGGWQGKYGCQPNSLIRNNGDATFTDVTIEAGMLSFHPTQTATWNDFNNDGWLDLFIGNESSNDPHPCELYLNKKDGTFVNVANDSGAGIIDFVKGVHSGDYNHDGFVDLFISTHNYRSYLLKNNGMTNGQLSFTDVSKESGFGAQKSKTFATWFWDYDNDGWLDIFISTYEFEKSLGYYEAAQLLNMPVSPQTHMKHYHNNGDGTFTSVAEELGLGVTANAMGANFGDVNHDGFLDFYLGTGNPDSKSIVPNRMYLNQEGKSFVDITSVARVGNLQKGHGVTFGDIDNDGDEDIYLEIGGSFKGDSYQSALYVNSENENNWIGLSLVGTSSNRMGIGAKITVTVDENGHERKIYRDMNAGGSFGGSSLRFQIGIGKASVVKKMEIKWPSSAPLQIFENVPANKFYKVHEGDDKLRLMELKKLTLTARPGI